MTITTPSGSDVTRADDTVNVTIDGVSIEVPKGTLVIRAAEQLGIAVPRFCDHPLLDPVAACRMCLIEIDGQPKPQPACAVACADGMVVRTQHSSEQAEEAQRSVMEFLLINHPLDCPVCDKGGECPLQNQAMDNGQGETRFEGDKRLFPKPINVSAQVLLDRERCVSCARCTRFSEQIAGDAFIELLDRGSQQQVGTAQGVPFNSYYSGNTIQICPVGALTSSMYRFRSRPFDLVSTATACEHCASGCAQRTDVRRNTITRRLAAPDASVNEEWNCDKGRFAFHYVTSGDRLHEPLVRNESGVLQPVSWSQALVAAAAGLQSAGQHVGVITGGRLSVEDALAYSKFARAVLGTNNVDFRSRPGTDEEQDFLASHVAGRPLQVSYADLEKAPAVLLIAFEPEDESPIVQLRLRKATRAGTTSVYALGASRTVGSRKLNATWLPASPGQLADVVANMASRYPEAAAALREPGSIIVVGERAALSPGLLSAVAEFAAASNAQVAWIPRRAGERGAVEAGLLPTLLPGGRPVTDEAARADLAERWNCEIPAEPGLDRAQLLSAAANGSMALVLAGVDTDDWPDREAGIAALDSTAFVVAVGTHATAVTDRAHVVLPVATAPEKAGSFLNWEGRVRRFQTAIRDTGLMSDARVLSALATEMGTDLGLADLDAARAALTAVSNWSGPRAAAPNVQGESTAESELVVDGWRPLLDDGVLQQGEPYLAATARPLVARMSAATAQANNVVDGQTVTIVGGGGSLERPVVIDHVVDGVVLLTDHLSRDLGALPGDAVSLSAGRS